MEVPEKGNMRTTGSPPKKVMETLAQLECIYSNVQGIDNKQGEPYTTVQQENYDIVAIMETWWDDLHSWSAAMDSYKIF